MVFNKKEAMKEIRACAKKNGLTFKLQNATINGHQAYKFTSRKTGLDVLTNRTFWASYENCCSGYIDTLKQG